MVASAWLCDHQGRPSASTKSLHLKYKTMSNQVLSCLPQLHDWVRHWWIDSFLLMHRPPYWCPELIHGENTCTFMLRAKVLTVLGIARNCTRTEWKYYSIGNVGSDFVVAKALIRWLAMWSYVIIKMYSTRKLSFYKCICFPLTALYKYQSQYLNLGCRECFISLLF